MLAINYLSPGMDERNASLSALLPHPFFGFIDSKGHSRFVLRSSILAVSLGALAKGFLVGWRIHRGFCDVCDDGANHMHGNPASAGLGLRLRQNNQNSQNEPGMSFGINKPCRTRWGPRQGCRWVSEADRGRVELTVAVKHREKADGWEKGQP